MISLKKTTLLLALCLMSLNYTFSQNTTIDKDINYLFKISGVETTYKNAIGNMIDIISKNIGNIDEESLKELKVEFSNEENIAEIMNSTREIYKKHFTPADIKGLIAFYESPVGKKFTEKQTPIMTESMAVGEAWGRKLGEKVAQKIMDKKK